MSHVRTRLNLTSTNTSNVDTHLFKRELLSERALDSIDLEDHLLAILHLLVHQHADVTEQFIDVEIDLLQVVAVTDDVHDVLHRQEVEAWEELTSPLQVRQQRAAAVLQVVVHLLQDLLDV